MKDYFNHNTHTVHLTGPDGVVVKVKSGQRIRLDEYFDRYRTRGFIRLATETKQTYVSPRDSRPAQARIQLSKKQTHAVPPPTPPSPPPAQAPINPHGQQRKVQRVAKQAKKITATKIVRNPAQNEKQRHRHLVGRRSLADATELLKDNLIERCFPISNNIGVGILSYNRGQSLCRLVDSLIKYTDLRSTTVFISDDGSTDKYTLDYLSQLESTSGFVVIKNSENIGIAGNSNRLLRCLSRFAHGLILNDDVEVLQPGWEQFYANASRDTGIHHFQHRQLGVYNAEYGAEVVKGSTKLRVVKEKPHGAILSFTNEMLVKCGFFDEDYGQYGMEHVDWSMKPHDFKMQESGFFDVVGSEDYFRLNSEPSSISNRGELLKIARDRFSRRIPICIKPTDKSKLPEVSYVVPFRNIGRQDSITTVVNGIRAQRFPVINIILVEQDAETSIDIQQMQPVNYYIAQELGNRLFNKSKAFNYGVSKSPADIVILHDADMLVRDDYTSAVYSALQEFESCHLGGTVLYTSEESANKINETYVVSSDLQCDRAVGYYEGGSLACRTSAYWKVGGFNEDFWGYGCEDCDFYARLSQSSTWKEDRTFDLLHLWHGRVDGWNKHHEENKRLESSLNSKRMNIRINMQHNQLRNLGYAQFIE